MGVFKTAGLWQSELSILISVGFELFDPLFLSYLLILLQLSVFKPPRIASPETAICLV